jgi:uncharacterized protein YdgA (DUF945 family)
MKKLVFVIVLLLLAVASATPRLIGNLAHEQYLKLFDGYPVGVSGITFEHKSYVQSWFSSEAVTVVKIPLGTPDAKDINMVLTSHIGHGPVVSTDKGMAVGVAYVKSDITFVDLPEAIQTLVNQYLPAGTFTTASLIDFKQGSKDEVHVGSINFGNDKPNAVFGGLNITGVSKLDYSVKRGKIELPASHFSDDNFALDIANASGSYDQRKQPEMMLMLGKTDLTFPLIKVVAKQGSVTLEDFKIASNSEEQSGKLNMAASISIGKITAPIPVSAFQYDMEMKQVDVRAVDLWGEITREMRAKPVDPALLMANPKLNQFMELLLQKDLALNQHLTLDGMGGRMRIDWDTRFAGLPEGVHIEGMEYKAQLMKAVDMHIVANIDEKVLMATPMAAMVEPYIQKGMIVKQGDKLVADIRLAVGMLSVNGIPVPLPTVGANKQEQSGTAPVAPEELVPFRMPPGKRM